MWQSLWGPLCWYLAVSAARCWLAARLDFLASRFAFGLSLLAMVYTIGPISGCHVNPAVTLGVLMAKKISSKDAAIYIVAQIIGAILASVTILLVARGVPGGYDVHTMGLGANGFGAHSPGGYSIGAAFLVEVVLTAFLVLTVLGSTDLKAPVGFARGGDRAGADADSPGRDSDYEYVGEPGAEHWAGLVCRRLGDAAVVAVYCRADVWSGRGGVVLFGDSRAGSLDHDQGCGAGV